MGNGASGSSDSGSGWSGGSSDYSRDSRPTTGTYGGTYTHDNGRGTSYSVGGSYNPSTGSGNVGAGVSHTMTHNDDSSTTFYANGNSDGTASIGVKKTF